MFSLLTLSHFFRSDFQAPDLTHQSTATTPTSDVSSAVYRDSRWSHFLVKSFHSDVVTLWDNFVTTVKNVPSNRFMATRKVTAKKNAEGRDVPIKGKYEWDSYQQTFQEVSELGKGLSLLGFTPGSGVGIFTKNRKEYVVMELASYSLAGYVSVY